MNKQTRFIETETKKMVAREMGDGWKGEGKYSHNIVISLHGDRWSHCKVKNVESLQFIPETNIILYNNYT